MLTPKQIEIHEAAIRLCRDHRLLEWKIIEVLQQIESDQIFKKLGYSSLFQYGVHELGLTSAVIYNFISVARKSREVEQLRNALSSQTISVARAGRIAPAINSANAKNLISFALTHTQRETDFEVARLNPRSGQRPKAKILSGDQVELTVTISRKTFEGLDRIKSLEAQKGCATDSATAIEAAISEYLRRHDPIQKAERAKKELRANRVPKAQVIRRDHGRCTYRLSNGQRCDNERWIHVHHIRPRSHGGSNQIGNLTTLCAFHHDLVHQIEMPLG